VEYRTKTEWNKVQKGFNARAKEYAIKNERNRERITRQIEEEAEGENRRPKEYLDSDEEREFFRRMEQNAAESGLQRLQLERRVMAEKYPFEPKISSSTSGRSAKDEFGLDADYFADAFDGDEAFLDPVKAFLGRVDEDLSRRKKTMPERFELPLTTKIMIRERNRIRSTGKGGAGFDEGLGGYLSDDSNNDSFPVHYYKM
jgi:hypothetical protein